MAPRTVAFLIAAAFTILIYLAARWLMSGALVRGADDRPSASKAQWWVWTATAIFGYVAVFVERWMLGEPGGAIDVPQNLFIAMGFSTATMAVAKGVTVSYVVQGVVDKGPRGQSRRHGGLFTDDDGFADLVKVQMFAFTAIAVAVYMVRLATQSNATGLPVLVDIDPALMVLTGLSHGGYLGDKIATRGAPAGARRHGQLEQGA